MPRAKPAWSGLWLAPVIAALGVFAWLTLPSSESMTGRVARDAGGTLQGHAGGRASSVLSATPRRPEACSALTAHDWQGSTRHDRQLDLEDYARFVTSADSELGSMSATVCGIELTLTDGTLLVHARALRGAALVVHTMLADVEVRGTMFRVDSAAARAEVSVSVAEGTVWVTRRDTQERVVLHAGQRLTLRNGVASEAPMRLLPRALEGMRERLGMGRAPSPAVESEIHVEPGTRDAARPSPPESEPLESRVWRQGTLSAPRIAPEPGSSATEDGHPMPKPHVTEGAKP